MPCAKIIFVFQNEKQQRLLRTHKLFFFLMKDAIQLLSPRYNVSKLTHYSLSPRPQAHRLGTVQDSGWIHSTAAVAVSNSRTDAAISFAQKAEVLLSLTTLLARTSLWAAFNAYCTAGYTLRNKLAGPAREGRKQACCSAAGSAWDLTESFTEGQ